MARARVRVDEDAVWLIHDLTKQKQTTEDDLGKIKKDIFCCKSARKKIWKNQKHSSLHPALIEAAVHLQQSVSLSVCEKSFYQLPAFCFYSLLWASELLDQGQESTRGVWTQLEMSRMTKLRIGRHTVAVWRFRHAVKPDLVIGRWMREKEGFEMKNVFIT